MGLFLFNVPDLQLFKTDSFRSGNIASPPPTHQDNMALSTLRIAPQTFTFKNGQIRAIVDGEEGIIHIKELEDGKPRKNIDGVFRSEEHERALLMAVANLPAKHGKMITSVNDDGSVDVTMTLAMSAWQKGSARTSARQFEAVEKVRARMRAKIAKKQ